MAGKDALRHRRIRDLLGRFSGGRNASRSPQGKDASATEKLNLALTRSGLFQAKWYLAQNPDVAKAGLQPLDHFLLYGGFEGRAPNPLFDPAWYLQQNPDVAEAKMNPLVHYVLYGEGENRNPSLYFDVEWYRTKHRKEIRADGVLAHYLRHRHLHRHAPNPFFDPAFYLATNADVAKAAMDPLEHFLGNGWRELRNPCADFDVPFYVSRHLRNDSRDPLTHYLEVGRGAGLPVRPDDAAHTTAEQVRRFASKSPEFEELDPGIVGNLRRRAKVFAFYLPQFHAIPENDQWWGKGFTEWTNVARATPRFVGHYQPRIPRDFGFYDLNDPSVMPRQVEAAKAAGLEGFCFYYYNFNGKRLLEKPIDGFLARPELDIPFCLMWANENWTRRWDGCDSEILLSQDYRDEDSQALIDDIARHFSDSRYLRIRGRPLFLLYRLDTIPTPALTLAKWRDLFRTRHGEDPLVIMAQGFGNFDPTEHGFDGAVEFPPHKVTSNLKRANSECISLDAAFSANILKYDDIVQASLSEPPPSFPLIKTVIPSWDNDARRQGQGMSVLGSSPAKYEHWLDGAIRSAQRKPFNGEPLVFINAWNEWAEAAYLEPDLHFGGAYLNATARAIVGLTSTAARRKIVLVEHSANPATGHTSLIDIGRTLREQFGAEVRFLLGGEGPLLSAYRDAAPTIVANGTGEISSVSKDLAATGFSCAILNALAAGSTVSLLKDHGIRALSLVDEPVSRIEDKSLLTAAQALARDAEEIVFATPAAREAFVGAVGVVLARTSVLPPASPITANPARATARTSEPAGFDDYSFRLLERLEPELKRVSVIVPNYNYAHYLVERLASIFGQTYPIFETIVLDDCSTDDSLARLAEIASATKRRIKVVGNDTNSGNVFAQWAKGVGLARGELIWIAEADDIADPDFLERLAVYFDDPTTALAFSDSRAIDAAGNITGESYKTYYAQSGAGTLGSDLFEDARRFAVRHLSRRNLMLNVSSVMWRRERLVRALAESEHELSSYRLAGDWRLYLGACSLGGRVGYCAQPLNSHRRHEGGVTSRLNAERHLMEVERAQSFFNSAFGEDPRCIRDQRDYREELRVQFGLRDGVSVVQDAD